MQTVIKKKIYGLEAKEQTSRQFVSFNVFSGFYPIGPNADFRVPEILPPSGTAVVIEINVSRAFIC